MADDKRPKLSDLKESGSIEEDCDLCIFLHRPEYYEPNNEDLKGKAEMIVAKAREGAIGSVECRYEGRYMRWVDSSQAAAASQDKIPW